MYDIIYELDLNLGAIMEIIDQYDVKFSNMGVKGRINYETKTISINPLFNDCNLTLLHEIIHHQIDNVFEIENRFSECDIDSMAAEILEQDEKIYDYLTKVIDEAPLEKRLRTKEYNR